MNETFDNLGFYNRNGADYRNRNARQPTVFYVNYTNIIINAPINAPKVSSIISDDTFGLFSFKKLYQLTLNLIGHCNYIVTKRFLSFKSNRIDKREYSGSSYIN